MAKRKIEAWAVVVFDDFISAREDVFGNGIAVFRERSDAEKFLQAQPEMERLQAGKVVPCTITFKV